jgi:hypothetical protein
MKCKGCGYWLRGLRDCRCPECGRAFDPKDPSTFDQDGEKSRRSGALACFSLMGTFFYLVMRSGLAGTYQYGMLLGVHVSLIVLSVGSGLLGVAAVRRANGCGWLGWVALALAAGACCLEAFELAAAWLGVV